MTCLHFTTSNVEGIKRLATKKDRRTPVEESLVFLCGKAIYNGVSLKEAQGVHLNKLVLHGNVPLVRLLLYQT